MAPSDLADAPLDLDSLRGLTADYDGLLASLLAMFVAQAPAWCKELDGAFASGEPEQVRRVCHKIKGSAATLRAQGIIAAASDLGGHAARCGLLEADDHRRRLLAAIDHTVHFVQRSGHLAS